MDYHSKKSECHEGRIHFHPDEFKLKQFKLNNFFLGKMMTVEDFKLEQNYFKQKRYLINRLIHGRGIVCGLDVASPLIHDGDSWRADISEGCAVDCCGREIIVSKRFACGVICPQPTILQRHEFGLYLREVDFLVDSVPSPIHASKGGHECYNSHIEEKFELLFDYLPERAEKPKCNLDDLVVPTGDIDFDKSKIINGYHKLMLDKCPSCEEMRAGGPRVLLAVLCWQNGMLVVDQDKTMRHRKLLCTNEMLCDLLTTLLCELRNTEKVKASRPRTTSGLVEISRHKEEEKSSVYVISGPHKHNAGPRPPVILLGKMDTTGESHDYIDDLPFVRSYGKTITQSKYSHKQGPQEWLKAYLSGESHPVFLKAIEITNSDFKILALFHAKSKEHSVIVQWMAFPTEVHNENLLRLHE
jgi:hypothetical protein